jgi:hypothetical protein
MNNGAMHVGLAQLRDVDETFAGDKVWVNAPGIGAVSMVVRLVCQGGGWLDTTTCQGQQLLHGRLVLGMGGDTADC